LDELRSRVIAVLALMRRHWRISIVLLAVVAMRWSSQRGSDAATAARHGAQRGSPSGRYTESLAPHVEQAPVSHVFTRRLPVTQPAV
jgi:hypothetical protein